MDRLCIEYHYIEMFDDAHVARATEMVVSAFATPCPPAVTQGQPREGVCMRYPNIWTRIDERTKRQ
jgi:hypothetical protein